jgi:hypothetical protein
MDARKSLDFDANLRGKEEFYKIQLELSREIEFLKTENIALKTKMTLMYSNWHYDYDKYEKLKEKCRKNVNSEVDNLNMDLSNK